MMRSRLLEAKERGGVGIALLDDRERAIKPTLRTSANARSYRRTTFIFNIIPINRAVPLPSTNDPQHQSLFTRSLHSNSTTASHTTPCLQSPPNDPESDQRPTTKHENVASDKFPMLTGIRSYPREFVSGVFGYRVHRGRPWEMCVS